VEKEEIIKEDSVKADVEMNVDETNEEQQGDLDDSEM